MMMPYMIPVKEAVARAIEFAENMLQPPADPLTPPGSVRPEVLLEEVELSKDGPNDIWLITLSVPGRARPLASLGRREYKVFTVRADTGDVVSMKIRELAGAQ
jgi:hypothetical protein